VSPCENSPTQKTPALAREFSVDIPLTGEPANPAEWRKVKREVCLSRVCRGRYVVVLARRETSFQGRDSLWSTISCGIIVRLDVGNPRLTSNRRRYVTRWSATRKIDAGDSFPRPRMSWFKKSKKSHQPSRQPETFGIPINIAVGPLGFNAGPEGRFFFQRSPVTDKAD